LHRLLFVTCYVLWVTGKNLRKGKQAKKMIVISEQRKTKGRDSKGKSVTCYGLRVTGKANGRIASPLGEEQAKTERVISY